MPLFYDTWPFSAMANGQIKGAGNAGNSYIKHHQGVGYLNMAIAQATGILYQ